MLRKTNCTRALLLYISGSRSAIHTALYLRNVTANGEDEAEKGHHKFDAVPAIGATCSLEQLRHLFFPF